MCRLWAHPVSLFRNRTPTTFGKMIRTMDVSSGPGVSQIICFTKTTLLREEDFPLTIKTRGIVLAQTQLSSQDRILTLLTSDMGLIDVFTKVSHGKKGRAAAATEVLAYSEFCLFKGKTRYILDAADLENNFFGLREDLTSLSLAAYFCELCRFVMPDETTGGEALRLLLNTLYLLEQKKRSPAFLKAVFELRLLTLCGFAPDVEGCAICGTVAEDNTEFFWFLPSEGQLACLECISAFPPETVRIPMPPGVRLAFCHVIESEEKAVFSFKLSPEGEQAFADAAETFAVFHLGGRFKSLDFYKSIL